ncbi:MAG: T9SS type A sorting domain-containing protein [Bacteroidales bacterium]|nr:T9SS type A sorting domain-containing protein [Bacteroidales bacterium]
MKNKILLITLFAFFGLSATHAQTSTYKNRVVYNNVNHTPLSGVTVVCINEDGEEIATALSGDDGSYEFEDLEWGEYTLTGRYNLIVEDVDILDPIMISKHIDGTAPIEEGSLAYKAADVTADNGITIEDYNLVMLSMSIPVDFPAGKWQFSSSKIVHNGTKGATDDHPRGTASSDVNSTWDPDIMKSPVMLNKTNTLFTTQNELVIPVVVDVDDYVGYYFEMEFPAEMMEIVEIIPTQSGQNIEYSIIGDLLKLTYYNVERAQNNEMFELKVNLKSDFSINDVIDFKVGANTQFANASGEIIKDAKVSIPNIKYGINPDEMTQVYPNPSQSGQIVTIDYIVPTSGQVCAIVYNNLGQQVQMLVNEYQNSGDYQIRVSDLAPGHYIYQISVLGNSEFNAANHFIVR